MNLLKSLAPTVATALGGPFAGIAMRALSKALGHKVTKESLSSVLSQADPETLLKVKEAENELIVSLEKLGVEKDRLSVENTKSARRMLIDTRSFVPAILSIATVAGFFGLLIGAALGHLQLTGSDVMMLLLGVLARETASVYNFWLGSSQSSKDKTELLLK